MADPREMVRSDGTRVAAPAPPLHPSWRLEFYSLWVALVTDPMILLLYVPSGAIARVRLTGVQVSHVLRCVSLPWRCRIARELTCPFAP